MAFGSAVLLFVLGAILTFAVDIDLQGVNLDVIGYILMAAGLVGGIVSLIMSGSRRMPRTQSSTQEVHPTADGGQIVHTENRS